MIRIAITGPESSGKTTLSEALSQQLNGLLVPEYARTFIVELDREYTFDDLKKIAEKQFEMNSAIAEKPYLIADTEMIVMKIWSEFKYGTCDATIRELLNQQQFDHYFLCSPDIPWEKDQLREHPEQREELFNCYLKELQSKKLPFTVLSGDLENRIQLCLQTLDFPA